MVRLLPKATISRNENADNPSVTRFSERNAYLNARIPPGKQNALEEAPEADSIPSGEARERSKPRQRIPGFKDRAADSAMLTRHARRDCSSSSTTRHETIPCRSLSQTRVRADY